ncbi:MAG: hypothetical protein A3K19_06960 [Lentisphaerae bacterium RIFOXYB12_FULL_65_16]|nr:MAG: hypothetical protein A3K18_22685 [Lentisphaerae bacterium RIFOXYA12_64_32]OGV93190.1 MAG: hypothetical protein A3K19_06960 [Lentisphaerae bacterium RIFOXYB12_FULL_65_16]
MDDLTTRLSSFDAAMRRQALEALGAGDAATASESLHHNMHIHTFFSFNGEGWSPSQIAWEAKRQGLYAIAICDFDVLAGLDELLQAGDLLGLRAAVGFESRTFFSEYAQQEINSPGEPGVFYFMGMGFVKEPAANTQAGRSFGLMLAQSHQRNRAVIDRINARLTGFKLDYGKDVLPLTPQGNATERHIIRAYHEKAFGFCNHEMAKTARYWAEALKLELTLAATKIGDANAFQELLRAKLIKKGGLGYVQPGRETFPALDDVIRVILACDAIPTSTWLDGCSEGEKDPAKQLECLMAKGVAAVNIIPDRNWNIKDLQEKARKVAELHRYIEVANGLDLPIVVGTELNRPGQRFVDDFGVEALRSHLPTFLRGAQIMIGHTRLLRFAGMSYVGGAAQAAFASRKARNDFFAGVGALPCPDAATLARLARLPAVKARSYLADCAKAGRWQ